METILYARVSSERQEHEQTVLSQLVALQELAKRDGHVEAAEIADEGYSRDDLARPGLDRLRDRADAGMIRWLYVHSPDRLASGPKLMLLVEELQARGVQVIFATSSFDDTPEGKMFLGMQGLFAEYERVKIAERTRRGKGFWSEHGAFVGGWAPYGYSINKRTEHQRASLSIDPAKAAVVRQLYGWLVDEQMSTRAIAVRLTREGVATAKQARQWQPTAVDRILRNPAYKGEYTYGRTRRVRQEPKGYKRRSIQEERPPEEWTIVHIPAIVDADLWNAAQAQLEQNARHSRRNRRRHYLLSGLVKCPRCGGNYTGHADWNDRRVYRCGRTDAAVSSTGQRCASGALDADQRQCGMQSSWRCSNLICSVGSSKFWTRAELPPSNGSRSASNWKLRFAGLAIKKTGSAKRTFKGQWT